MKKWIAALVIVAVISGGIGVMIGRQMPAEQHRPEQAAAEQMTQNEHSTPDAEQAPDVIEAPEIIEAPEPQPVVITKDEWTDIVLAALGLDGAEAKMTQVGEREMLISGKVSKEIIKDWIAQGGGEAGGMYSSVIMFLPKQIPMEMGFTIDIDGSVVTLTGTSIAMKNLDIPSDVISPDIWQAINESVNASLHSRMETFSAVEISDGGLILHP